MVTIHTGKTRDVNGRITSHYVENVDCLPCEILAGTYHVGTFDATEDDLRRAIAETEATGELVSWHAAGIEYESEEQ